MFLRNVKSFYSAIAIIIFLQNNLQAQVKDLPGSLNNYANGSKPLNVGNDTSDQKLEHRDQYADSITITYRYWDSTHINKIDSSISDFFTRFPVPYNYIDMGNLGSAARNLIFNTTLKPGWDAGFHAYDIYR